MISTSVMKNLNNFEAQFGIICFALIIWKCNFSLCFANIFLYPEAVLREYFVKKVFLKISQDSQEKTWLITHDFRKTNIYTHTYVCVSRGKKC